MSATDIAQTVAIAVATLLAFLSYQSNRRDRLNAVDERHLESLAARLAALLAVVNRRDNGAAGVWDVTSAQRDVEMALMYVWQDMPLVEQVTAKPPDQLNATDLQAAAAQLAEAIAALPRRPSYVPLWLDPRRVYWKRLFSLTWHRVGWPYRRIRRIFRPIGEDEVEA